LPCDVIHLDIHYMDDYRCFTWNRDRFPAPREMLADLREKGFRAMAIIDPGIKVDDQYAVYREGVRRDVFVKYPDGTRFTGPVWPGDCHFPDFTDPEVRAWWGELYRGLLEDGLSAFWNDMNEPALITVRPEYASVPDVVRHDAEGRGADHAEMHNLYGMLMVRASAEGLRRLQPDRRPLILTRSGWAGVQRYALHWTGDNASTWDHLRLSIQMVLNLGLSGIPITGPDVGGFTGGPGPELYARWMQVGAFMPFFRVHSMSGSPDQEPWAFGPEVEAISRRYLELRYRLLPYLYTAVWQASRTGIPVARAMSFVYPADPHTPGLDTQYLFGDSFLVAPVLEQGATSRPVYLPPGTWYDFWTGQQYHGGQTISVAAPLETLPLFVRAGSVIPLWPVQQHVGEKVPAPLTLAAYWAPGEHSSLLYEDDGLCANYESPEAHRLSRFVLRGGEEGTIGALVRLIEQGEYQPPASPAVLRLVGMSRPPSAIMLEGGTLINWEYSPETRSLQVEFDAPREFTLSLR
ncbi:MAG TPA: alpha-glucosidase, partial [Chloroflexi bacterium]|nr:alpha-glucosidase [Chloroflexota bacterium]